MSGYKSFAVAGAGNAGRVIAEELLKKKDAGEISSMSILTRSSGKHKDLAEKGAKVVVVDYTSPLSLESALDGVDVVVSALGLNGIKLQAALATSAKAMGAKLFVTSDFGTDPHSQTDYPLFMSKGAIKEKLKELQLPYAVFYTGVFTEKVLFPIYAPVLGLNFAAREFNIPGSGTAQISWTTTEDMAQFVARALIELPSEKIEWRAFRIEGDRISFNDIAAVWSKHTGQPVTMSHRPRSEFEEAVKKNPMDYISMFILQLDSGNLVVGEPSAVSNSEFPDWKPKKVIDVLIDIYG